MSSENLPQLPAPYSPTKFLDWMKGDTPGLYLLGSLNRHITVHSQQCRAINLIQALKEHGDGLDEKSLAIVGAGFAGLTAAAFALERTTAQVSLFDASPRPLWLQDRCANRWLHPGIYDWPYPGSLEPRTSLPVLNWRAAAAFDVAAQVSTEWERIAATKGLLRLRLNTEVKAVCPNGNNQLALELSNGDLEHADVVVLAVGFGIERGGPARIAYWNDADGLDGLEAGSSVLVSGFGDGGLSDVLRLCLPEIRQNSLIELLRHVPLKTCRELIEAEKNFNNSSGSLDEFYGQLRIDQITQLLGATGPVPRVTLAGIGRLYDPQSAILNRFLISQLRQARGEDAFELINEPVDLNSVVQLPDGRWRVKIGASATERKFDYVILRVGPEAVYQRISSDSDLKVWEERRKHWIDMPQSLDSTRTLLKAVSESGNNNLAGQRQDFIAYESSSRRWCLVLYAPGASIEWEVHLKQALQYVAHNIANMNVAPLLLSSEEALTAEAIRGTVRALCAADIVVADVSTDDPIIFLLLGIRATVRRGVTIACTKKQFNDELWDNIPFNLKELNLVSFFDAVEGQKELQDALQAGLTQSGVSAHYLDLPVYDYVREESSDEATADPRRVLLLRAFRAYRSARLIHVQNRIRQALGFPNEVPVESLIDQVSPRLAGQRLYEAIRHWKNCVVDLTWWRPNVMFELGVRLAATSAHTVCLIDPTAEGMEPIAGSQAELVDLLRPFQYNLITNSFAMAFPEDPPANPVYEVAAQHFRTSQDRYDEQVDDLLLAAAALTKGHDDPLQDVDFSPLYARGNRSYGNVIRHSVFERLCAAWYYIADREEPFLFSPTDLLDKSRAATFRRFRDLSARLKAGLANRTQPRDERLRQRIVDTENQAKASGAMAFADLIDAWSEVRSDPPWQVKQEEVDRDRSGFIQDWKDQLEKLTALEAMLVSFDNPVCEFLLQGVGLDRRRVELVLQKFRKDNT